MNVSLADFNRAATLAMQNQGLSGEDSVIHMSKDENSVNAMGRTWRRWGSSGRTAEFKEANRATRQALLDALTGELNIDFTKKENIPKSLLKVLNLGNFSLGKDGKVTSNKPLTARRITLISKAVEDIKAERAKSAKATFNASVRTAVNNRLNELIKQNPGRFSSVSNNAVGSIANFISTGLTSGTGVDDIAYKIATCLNTNATHYGMFGLDQTFPALRNIDREGLTDQVKDFVNTVIGNLPNGAPAPKVVEKHGFNFQAEQPAVKPAPEEKPVAQKAVSNVTVKMNPGDFFKLMQAHVDEAKKRPDVEMPRFRPQQQNATQFLNWMKGLATMPSSKGKIVRNAEELTDKVLSAMQNRNNGTTGCNDETLFPEVKKAVQLTNKGVSPEEAWKDIRADIANIVNQVFDFKAE